MYRRYHHGRRQQYNPPPRPVHEEKLIPQEDETSTDEVTWKQEACHDEYRFKKYTEHKNQHGDAVIKFNSGEDLVECFNKNLKFVGGSGQWNTNDIEADGKRNEWTFGNDLPDHYSTSLCVEEGRFPQKYMALYEKTKDELFTKFPKLHQLTETAITKRRRRKFTEDGAELDIDRYMTGDTEIWGTVMKTDVRSKSASLYIEIGVSCGTETETITKNVIFMAVLADILELAGITTDIYFGATGSLCYQNMFHQILVKAKSAGEPLDLARILSFAAPGFYRQFVFAAWANTDRRVSSASRRCIDGFAMEGSYQCGRVLTLINPQIKLHGATQHISDGQTELFINAIKKILNIDL
jgi:hypothetical protein